MADPTEVLLQTTIPFTEDDWHIGRFSLLRAYLCRPGDEEGLPLFYTGEVGAGKRVQKFAPVQ